MEVPFFRFTYGEEELANIREVLDSGWLTTGRFTAELERRFAERCGTKHALAINSCTAALHLLLEAQGICEGDKVVVPSLTFTATAEIVRYLGADPVFVDVDASTGLMTAANLQAALDAHQDIKACIVVHYGGQSAELTGADGLLTLCETHGIKLIQDAAHAFPAADDYGPVGAVGDGTCFSFYANKTITTGEGGLVVLNDDAVAKRIKVMRLHGIDRDVWDRYTSKAASWDYNVVAPGYKYNMPDLNAAVGTAQLERANAYRDARQAVAMRYLDTLGNLKPIRFLKRRVNDEQHAWHLLPIILLPDARLSRDDLYEKLRADGIGTSVHYRPLHQMTYYRDRYTLVPEDFPSTEAIWKSCLSLPLFPSMTVEEVDYVCDRVRYWLS
jgi:dTDP-4-amino-4,6-dideoxygalactose transaminase